MSYGMCARCVRKMECKFRQQGTWVVECEYFREPPQVGRNDRRLDRAQRQESLRQPEMA